MTTERVVFEGVLSSMVTPFELRVCTDPEAHSPYGDEQFDDVETCDVSRALDAADGHRVRITIEDLS